jgi:alkanesulfonate monooxygenase SsuD/methylene tetrahydromethanopterin reductase-like flavin-dependent oxidoreductase (luciferase family)
MSPKPFVFLNINPGQTSEIIPVVQELERRGFPGVFSSGTPTDNIALSLALLDRTSSMTVGTGIAGIYLRHSQTMASGAALIEELHPGRFVLGLGVTHVPFLEQIEVSFGKPLSDMRRYVRSIKDSTTGDVRPPIVVGALRRKMTALAGEVGDGVMWANAVLSHLPVSMSALPDTLPDSFILSSSAPMCVNQNRAAALDGIKRYLLLYMKLEHYQNYFIEAGYESEVQAARTAIDTGDEAAILTAISEQLAEEVGVFGSPEEIRERVAAWYDAGLTHLILDPVPASDGDTIQAVREIFSVF